MAAQLIAAHNAAMECYRRAMLGEQTFEGRRENLAQANKLSRTYATLLDAARGRGAGAGACRRRCRTAAAGCTAGCRRALRRVTGTQSSTVATPPKLSRAGVRSLRCFAPCEPWRAPRRRGSECR
jgi:hypothetical protein